MANGSVSTAPFRVLVTPLASVPRDAAGHLEITIPTTNKRGSATGTEIPLRTAGVYPVELVLRAGDKNDELAKLVTFLVRLPDQPLDAPLRVAMVLPITGPPSLLTDGGTAIEAGVRAQLQAAVDVLSAAPNVPLSVQIQPELLDALSRTGLPTDGELQSRLLAAIGGRQTLTGTYVGLDATAMVDSGLDEELIAQLRRGEDVLTDELGAAAAERSIWTARSPLDESAVVFLRDLGFRQLLVPAGALAADPRPPGRDPPRPACGRRRATVRSRSPPPTPICRTPSARTPTPVRDAYLWLAELAYLALQPADNVSGPQGVVVLPDAVGSGRRLPQHGVGRAAGQPARRADHRGAVLRPGAAGQGEERPGDRPHPDVQHA